MTGNMLHGKKKTEDKPKTDGRSWLLHPYPPRRRLAAMLAKPGLKRHPVFDFFVPRYDPLSLFLMSTAFSLLYFINPELNAFTYRYLIEEFDLKLFPFYAVFFLFIAGIAFSILHVFMKGEKSEDEKAAMLYFAVMVNGLSGLLAGARLLQTSQGYLTVFPLWNILNSLLLLLLYWSQQLDETAITEGKAAPRQIFLGGLTVLVVFLLCQFALHLHWTLTFSVCVCYATNVNSFLERFASKHRKLPARPLDKYSSAREKPKRVRPSVTEGEVCFDTFGNEMAALEIKALLEGNGLAAEVIAGTGSGALTQLGIDQGFKLIINAKDWDKVVEIVATAEQAAAPVATPPTGRETGKWTRMTDAEQQVVTRRWLHEFAKVCAIGALLVATLCMLLRGGRDGAIKGYLVPPEEWPQRFLLGLLVGAVLGGIYYLSEQHKKTLVCLKCGRILQSGHSPCCPCGGILEDIRKLKWLAAPDSAQAAVEPVRCLVCEGILPAAADRCPKCGWTYKEERPEPSAGVHGREDSAKSQQ